MQWYRETFNSFTPSASFAVEWNDSAMTYLSYSEGFKGGGWNSHFNAVLTPAQQDALQKFEQEEAQTIELGAKFDLANDTMRLNLAVFTSDYTNMQLTYRGPAPAGVAPFITNAGETSIDGAEAEFTWAPTDDLLIDASVGYLDATIDSLANIPLAVLPPGLVEGNFLPFAPEWQTHLGIAYAGHAGSLEIKPRVDASFQPTTYFDATNTPEIAQLDDVLTVNASVVFSGGDDSPWSVTLGVNNAHRRGISDRGQLIVDHGQRLRGDRVLAAAGMVRHAEVRVLRMGANPGGHRGCGTRGAAAGAAVAQGGHRHTVAGAAQRGLRGGPYPRGRARAGHRRTCSSARAWRAGCTPKGSCTKAWRSAFAAAGIASTSRRSRARASRCMARPK